MGIVDEDTARWLAAMLTGNSAAGVTRTERLIAREILKEAQAFENDALATLAATLVQPKARRAGHDRNGLPRSLTRQSKHDLGDYFARTASLVGTA
jgi:hypothetical protein